jgi:subtilisin family serine protease
MPGRTRAVLSAVLACAVAAAVVTPLAPGARAVPPLPVHDLPCPGLSLADRTVLVALQPGAALPELPGATAWPGSPALGVRPVVLPSAAHVPAALAALRAAPGVRWAEPQHVVRATRTPNDPLFRRQWSLTAVRAPRAWDRTTGGVLVAVLDTGVDAGHPDLRGKVVAGGDFVDGDADPTDEQGHGTAVAGVVAARTHDRTGVAGASWGATVLAERVLDHDGVGSGCAAAVAVVDAADAGAKVINLSLGGPGTSCPAVYAEAFRYARDKGALVVVSSGNEAGNGNPTVYPGACDGVLSVGATDRGDRRAAFSTFGPTLDLVAPGDAVLVLLRKGADDFGYEVGSGTSYAAPLVAGVAALALARTPSLTPDALAARLVGTARDLGPRGRDDAFGAGLLDAARAVG